MSDGLPPSTNVATVTAPVATPSVACTATPVTLVKGTSATVVLAVAVAAVLAPPVSLTETAMVYDPASA